MFAQELMDILHAEKSESTDIRPFGRAQGRHRPYQPYLYQISHLTSTRKFVQNCREAAQNGFSWNIDKKGIKLAQNFLLDCILSGFLSVNYENKSYIRQIDLTDSFESTC